MSKQTINQLASDYRNGDEMALNQLVKFMSPLIERQTSQVGRKVDDTSKFDCRVSLKLRRALNDKAVTDFFNCAVNLIHRERKDFVERRSRKKEEFHYEAAKSENDESDYDFIEDIRYRPDELVDYKEMTDLLAQDDQRKNIIIEQWSRGATDLSISELLAQVLGGTAETHRKFVQRYRKTCRETIEANYDADSLCYA